ncbi:hypothetical protein [Paenibacillus odorifer]|uniref:hypothetical protein n=1 Tax=Paenibacillus odorifer TaxID=189426 RepID=UPI00096DF7C6|nr:hypothetical protein [Paenibacillus odorifer]OMD67624.1 hypothetical protein BSK50_30100 [Paenibacillus odorifer]
MYYGDKREAKVKIMSRLVDKGWKVFGYSPDQSDSMVDYYHPAHWEGIATKNGYTLLIDICNYNLSLSGKEQREYIYSSKRAATSERIEKLTALMNDAASTENEKASCAVLIEKEQEKAGIQPEYKVTEVYPVFTHANPKGTTWHIEKDGQIIAKGNGVFATNTYDWENEEKSAAEQKEEKLTALINRIEKALTDCDALRPEVVKVPVKTTQVVEKTITEVTEADIKEGFTIMMKVGYTHGKNKGNKYANVEKGMFSKLGKNNKPSKSFDKMWSPSVARINEMLSKGHIAVIEFVEVTEYVEKTVYKKTGRKQTVSNVPVIETPKKVDIKEETATAQKVDTQVNATLIINEEKNGIEISFTNKPDTQVIESLKENGFRWSSFSKVWWAKQTPEHLVFAQAIVKPSNTVNNEADAQSTKTEATPETVSEVDTDNQNDNVIYYEFNRTEESAEQKKEGDTMNDTNTTNDTSNTYFDQNNNTNTFNNFDTLDDIFSKFDKIEITTDQKISSDDLDFCQDQESIYNKTIAAYTRLDEQLQAIVPEVLAHGKKFCSASGYSQRTSFDNGFSAHDLKQNFKKIKDKFISITCEYFSEKYNVSIDEAILQKKYDKKVTYENIVEEIILQLDGHSFTEKAASEIKEKARNTLYGDNKIIIRNNKLILDGYYVRHDSLWKEYRLTERKDFILNAISHFDNGSVKINKELTNRYCGYDNEKKSSNYDRYETQSLSKVKSIKFLKNGKMEIEFASHTMAAKFAGEYCGYKKQAI